MKELPFEIPKSLQSFCEQYDKKSDKTIKRLEKQLKKNGVDAVSFFLLGWFYYQQGSQQKAIDCALKAKMLAPGSPFFKKLHYFFSHPDLFNAWNKTENPDKSLTPDNGAPAGAALNLDSLIDKLSAVGTIRIKPEQEYEFSSAGSVPEVEEVDDIASETLARVHEQQKNYSAAITVYQKLKLQKNNKSGYFDEKIAELKGREGEEKSE